MFYYAKNSCRTGGEEISLTSGRRDGVNGRGMAFETTFLEAFKNCKLKLIRMADANIKDDMATLSTVLEKLRLRKADNEFRWTPEGFTAGKGKTYQPEELSILRTYRFEGESNPSDASILYVIEANDQLIGYSLDAYGAYSNHDDEEGYDNFIRKIPIKDHGEQVLEDI